MDQKLQQVLLKDARNEIFDETEAGIFFHVMGLCFQVSMWIE